MPDVHLGIGATVGSVIPTLKAIIPVDLPFPRERTSDAFMAAFRGVHALIHLITPFCGKAVPWPLLARDFPGVILPALLTIWIAVVALRLTAREG